MDEANKEQGLETTYIYGLLCPVRNEVFYVGKSDDPVRRLEAHLKDASPGLMAYQFPHLYTTLPLSPYRSPRECWLAWLAQQGVRPELVVFEECSRERGVWSEREKYWIRRLLKEGHSLTNKEGVPQTGDEQEYLDYAVQRGRDLFGEEH